MLLYWIYIGVLLNVTMRRYNQAVVLLGGISVYNESRNGAGVIRIVSTTCHETSLCLPKPGKKKIHFWYGVGGDDG